MIKKYKDVDMKIQSSRMKIIIKLVPIIIVALIIFGIAFYSEGEGGLSISDAIKMISILLILLCVDLYITDWSAEIRDNVLFVRKWIFKYKIPFENLISVREEFNTRIGSNIHYESLIIEYKKENKIKHLKIQYLTKSPYMKIEYAKKSEISEFRKLFVHHIELRGTNISDENYKDIRTEREENELQDFINNKKKSEEKLMWIILFLVIIIPVAFFTYVFIAVV